MRGATPPLCRRWRVERARRAYRIRLALPSFSLGREPLVTENPARRRTADQVVMGGGRCLDLVTHAECVLLPARLGLSGKSRSSPVEQKQSGPAFRERGRSPCHGKPRQGTTNTKTQGRYYVARPRASDFEPTPDLQLYPNATPDAPPRQPPSLETMPMGKGSTQRPPCVPKSTVDDNYERTFPPKTPEDPCTKKTCSDAAPAAL